MAEVLDERLRLRWWWFLLPCYLTLWSLAFGLWNFVAPVAMFEAFDIPIEASTRYDLFVLQNSAARYLGIAAALVVGVFVLRTRASILTALTARFTMDVLDLVSGLRTGVIEAPVSGVLQSVIMFLAPAVLSVWLLRRASAPRPTAPGS